MKIAAYPPGLENWWVERACRHYGVSTLNDCATELEHAVQRLTDSFTVDRKPEFQDYQLDPELLLAFGIFYFPQSFIRIQFPLLEVLAGGWSPPGDRAIRILDLGAGAGAAGFGAVSLLQPQQMQAWALDQSDEALRIHAELSGSDPRRCWQYHRTDLRHPQQLGLPKMDLILLSFTLNEISSEFESILDFWLRRLCPQGVLLVLEPSNKPSSRRLKDYRDRLSTENKYRILAPAPTEEGIPLLQQNELRSDEAPEWEPPRSLLLLNSRLKRGLDVLNFRYLAISPAQHVLPAGGSDQFLLTTPFARAKGKWVATGCTADGVRHEYEILNRHLTPELKRRLHALKQGDTVRVSNVQPAGGRLRFDHLDEP